MKHLICIFLALGSSSSLPSLAQLEEPGAKVEKKEARVPTVREKVVRRPAGLANQRQAELEQSLDDPKKRAQLEQEFASSLPGAVRGTITARGKDELEIDRGKKDGVRAGSVVVTLEGLVGIVSKIDEGSCKVRLISHPESRVPVRLARSLEVAYLRGGGRGIVKLQESTIGKEGRPEFGTTLLTGLKDHVTKAHSAVPPNIVAAKIIDDDESESGWGIEITAPIAKLKSVIIFDSSGG